MHQGLRMTAYPSLILLPSELYLINTPASQKDSNTSREKAHVRGQVRPAGLYRKQTRLFFYSPFLKRQHHKCSYVLTALRTSRSDSDERRRPWRDIHLVCFSPACVQYPNVIELWGLAKGSRRICQHSKKEELKNVFFSKLKGKSLKEQNLCWHEVLYPQTLNSSLKRISSIKMPKGQGRNAITPINNSMYVCHTQESWNKTWVELVGTMDRSQQASEERQVERQNGHGQIASKAGDKE